MTQNEKEAIKISLAFKINLAYGLELFLGVMGVRKGEAHFNLKYVPKPDRNWMKKMASKKRRMRVNLRTDRSLKILVICPPHPHILMGRSLYEQGFSRDHKRL